MFKYLIIILFFGIINIPVSGQKKEYKLITRTEKADLKKAAILSIDTTGTAESRRNAFNPIRGKYTVYVFIAVFRGISYNQQEKDFHDILVIKTDRKKKILEAYQYTLEWAEMPFTSDLYQARAKGIILKNGLAVEKMKFLNIDQQDGMEKELKEAGILLL
jgi:hypothetical protein